MRWSPTEVAARTGGVLARPELPEFPEEGTRSLTAVAIDSRVLPPGALFVAIRAERDGHEWIGPAVEAGAGGVLVEEGWSQRGSASAVPVISVADTGEALLALGRAARDRLPGPVIGITGSVGKTSTKDLVAAALGAGMRTTSSERSFNNELGVPLTLANAPEDTQAAVIEMGARGPGHIRLLCQVARPSIGVVTAVTEAHTEMFGDLDGVARAKSELVGALPATGTAILNADDPRVLAMASGTAARVLRYSAGGPGSSVAEVVAEAVSLDAGLRPRFVARTPWGSVSVHLQARGGHQVGNALAALSVAGALGVPLEAAAAALAIAELSPWRMQLTYAPSGAAVLNDAYNANPASMAAALDALAALPASRRVAVLGEMAELGVRTAPEHLAVAKRAASMGIEIVAIATDAYGVAAVAGFDEAMAAVGSLGPGDAVLVKASRVVGLERLAARLTES